jgi:pimeloyl-ACP methyl ester carboxylesterase
LFVTLLIEIPVMPKVNANGINFHFQQSGEGPDVVLIHGVTGDLSIWFLCEAMGIFGRSLRVTAYDLRGHGYSDVPRDAYTSADQAGDLVAIMDALQIERAMLVGHSFGAVIAAHASVLYPDRIDAIVLSDPCFPALRHLEDVSRWGHWQNFREEAAEAGVILSDEHWYDLGRFFDQVLHLDGERLLRFRQAVGLPGFHRLLRLAGTTCGHDAKVPAGLTEELIRSIAQPVLAIFGEQSPFLATSDYLSANLPDCVNRLVPDAKHRAPEENASAFVEIVHQFLVANAPVGQAVRSIQ